MKDDSYDYAKEFEERKKYANLTEACPVCGSIVFEKRLDDDVCPVCGWFDTMMQCEDCPDEDNLDNIMSLNQAREAWKRGEDVC